MENFFLSARILKSMWLNQKFRRKFKAALDNAEIAQTSLHIKIKWHTNDV